MPRDMVAQPGCSWPAAAAASRVTRLAPLPALQQRSRGMPALRAPARSRRRAARVCAAAGGGLGGLLGLLGNGRRAGAGGSAAAKQLLELVAARSNDRAALDALVDELAASAAPFREASLGGGPWQVVYSRGPLLWQAATSPGAATTPARLLARGANRASQDFQPAGRRVVNRGQLLGGRLEVSAEGTYRPLADGARLPLLLEARIERGTLQAGARALPLPIRGSGRVTLAYCDGTLRVFQSSGGSTTVQVRQDVLARLLDGS